MKDAEFFKTAFKQGLTERGASYGRFTFFGVVLFVFSRLWYLVGDESKTTDPLWYLGMTELVVLSIPLIYIDIEDDVKTGNVAYLLIRPMSYLRSKFFESMGLLVSRMVILFPAAFGFCWLFSGKLPNYPYAMVVFLPFAVLSGALYILFQLVVGVSTFWTQDGMPMYLIIQKLVFILGGMILPLSIYPDWLREFCELTPFASMLALPVESILNQQWLGLIKAELKLIFWFILMALVLKKIFKICERKLIINGG